MVLYSSCVAEFRGNLFSLDFVLLIGLCNLNNLLVFYLLMLVKMRTLKNVILKFVLTTSLIPGYSRLK